MTHKGCKGYVCEGHGPQVPLCPLHAAAPELLVACQTIANDCQMILDGDDMSGMSDHDLFGAMQKTVMKAIRKAKKAKR